MQIAFDFDGVLCEYQKWQGHDHIGKRIQPTINTIQKLHKEGHNIKLHTTRLNPQPFGTSQMQDPLVLNGEARKIIEEWLLQHNILNCFSELTGNKPYADIYLDDKAVRFPQHSTDRLLYQLILSHSPQKAKKATR